MVVEIKEPADGAVAVAEPVVDTAKAEEAAAEETAQAEEDKAIAAAFKQGASTPNTSAAEPAPASKPDDKVAAEAKQKADAEKAAKDKAEAEKKAKEAQPEPTAEERLKKLVEGVKPSAGTQPEPTAEQKKAAEDAEKAKAEAEKGKVQPVAGAFPSLQELLAKPEAQQFKIRTIDSESGAIKEVTLAKMAEDMPEVVDTAIAVARLMLGAQPSGNGALPKELTDLQGQFPAVQKTVNDLLYWQTVQAEHPEALRILKSKKFGTWAESNPLVKGTGVLDLPSRPDVTIAVLDAYQESVGKEAQAKRDQAAAAEQRRKAGLHGDSLREGGRPEDGVESAADEDAAFRKGAAAP